MKRRKNTSTYLVIAGLVLVFGWPIFLGVSNLLQDLSCMLSPGSCQEGVSLGMIIVYIPIIIGAVLLPSGMAYRAKSSLIAKFITVTIAALALSYIAFWIWVFVGISIHGLKG